MPKNYKLPTKDVSASLVMDVVTRCSYENANIDSLIKYTDKGKQYVTSAIDAGCLLQMIEDKPHGTWSTVKNCAETLKSFPSKEIKLATFTKWLQMWNPFIIFLGHVQTGDNIDTAARKLSSLYLFNKDEQAVSKLLFKWAKNCKLMNSQGELLLDNQNERKEELLNEIENNLKNDVQAKLYLSKVLGESVFIWLKPDEILELENALLKYKEDPTNAVNCIGRALENVLKRLYVDLLSLDAKDLKKKNGICELGNYMYSKSLIHDKQYQIILALGKIRNMGGHGMEIESGEQWKISSTAAMGALSSTLALIKSLFHYVKYGKLIF